jgi:hypothetical protein
VKRENVIYLYAITDRSEESVPAEPGLEGTSLFNLTYQDIAAVVSSLTTSTVSPTEDNLWRHEAIVEALMADRTVLPVRFGTVLTDETAVKAALAAHHANFVADLDRVRGRMELSLRVLWEAGPPPTPPSSPKFPGVPQGHSGAPRGTQANSGRAYLLARLKEEHQRQAQQQRAEALADEIHTPLAQIAVESTRRVLITPRLLLTAAYLVEQGQVAAFRREVEALSAAYPALHFLCTGPWPAYNFVSRFSI